MSGKEIGQVLREQRDRIMAVPGVVGMGIGLCDGRPCLKVYVSEPAPGLAAILPESVDGYVVSIEETGAIVALPGES